MKRKQFFPNSIFVILLPCVVFRTYVVFDEQHEMSMTKNGSEADYSSLDVSGVSRDVSVHRGTEQVRLTRFARYFLKYRL